jgi:hypothetical protein
LTTETEFQKEVRRLRSLCLKISDVDETDLDAIRRLKKEAEEVRDNRVLGRNDTFGNLGREKSTESKNIRIKKYNLGIYKIVKSLLNEGATYAYIIKYLNESGLKSVYGKKFDHQKIKRLKKRMESKSD